MTKNIQFSSGSNQRAKKFENLFQMLNKKELKSCESPDPDQNGYDQMQNKFPKITNSDFDQLLKNQSMQESAATMVSIIDYFRT